ncbi:MAG: AAA family ATPase [Candidatus Abawacabacteria bacterium]|nr:AAA family ATPase [Candidatus Abawacabacteria bacterium]
MSATQTKVFDQVTPQDNLIKIMAVRGLSQADVCRATGLSSATVSTWLGGNYQAKDKRVQERINSFIRREKDKMEILSKKLPFCDTSIAVDIHEAMRNCHINCETAVITAPSGIGKTTAIKKYCQDNPDCILIQVMPGMTKKRLIKNIHQALGLDGIGSADDLIDDVIRILTNSGRLLILDEANALKVDLINLLRRIQDISDYSFGLLMAGLPVLIEYIRGRKQDLAQLNNRIGILLPLGHLDSKDVEILVKSVIPDASGEVCTAFYEATYSNTRILSKFISRSIEVAGLNHVPISPAVVSKVYASMKKLYG